VDITKLFQKVLGNEGRLVFFLFLVPHQLFQTHFDKIGTL